MSMPYQKKYAINKASSVRAFSFPCLCLPPITSWSTIPHFLPSTLTSRTAAVEQKEHRLLSHLDPHSTPNVTAHGYVTMDSYSTSLRRRSFHLLREEWCLSYSVCTVEAIHAHSRHSVNKFSQYPMLWLNQTTYQPPYPTICALPQHWPVILPCHPILNPTFVQKSLPLSFPKSY